jgi:5'(3')-deoxyribonucleotidase
MKIVYVDMDDVLADYKSAFSRHATDHPDIEFPQSTAGFFSGLGEIEGAIGSVRALIDSPHYDPYILSAPSLYNPLSYTEKRVWVEDKFGFDFVDRLILCAHKGLLKGDILIDDNHEGRGQEHFEGELIHFGSDEFPDWKAVRNYLEV